MMSSDIFKYSLERTFLGGKYHVYYNKYHNGGGKDLIDTFLRDYKLPKFNSVMEFCSGPGFMGYYLMHKYNLPEVHLVDINSEVKPAIDLTNQENDWNGIFYLSDALENYNGPKVDFIITNPPHCTDLEQFNKCTNNKKNQKNILLDQDLDMHKKFANKLNKVLNKGGHLMLIENKVYIPVGVLDNLFELKKVDYGEINPVLYYVMYENNLEKAKKEG
mgnify:CR=1 FL=1